MERSRTDRAVACRRRESGPQTHGVSHQEGIIQAGDPAGAFPLEAAVEVVELGAGAVAIATGIAGVEGYAAVARAQRPMSPRRAPRGRTVKCLRSKNTLV